MCTETKTPFLGLLGTWNSWWAGLGNVLLKIFTFSACGIQAGDALCSLMELLGFALEFHPNQRFHWVILKNCDFDGEFVTSERAPDKALCTRCLFMSWAVLIDLNISSGRERARLEQSTVAQRKMCLWCVTEAFSGLSWDVHLCVLCATSAAFCGCMTLCSLGLSKRRVFLGGTLCHLGCCWKYWVLSPGHRGDPHCTVTHVRPVA